VQYVGVMANVEIFQWRDLRRCKYLPCGFHAVRVPGRFVPWFRHPNAAFGSSLCPLR